MQLTCSQFASQDRADRSSAFRRRWNSMRHGSDPSPCFHRTASRDKLQQWSPHIRGLLHQQHRRKAQQGDRRALLPRRHPPWHQVYRRQRSTVPKIGCGAHQSSRRAVQGNEMGRGSWLEARCSHQRSEAQCRAGNLEARAE
ncbi:hypothetical protein LINPERPRIM_LOCUS36219 [Linum perenne]